MQSDHNYAQGKTAENKKLNSSKAMEKHVFNSEKHEQKHRSSKTREQRNDTEIK
jgi:hypothetical protein